METIIIGIERSVPLAKGRLAIEQRFDSKELCIHGIPHGRLLALCIQKMREALDNKENEMRLP